VILAARSCERAEHAIAEIRAHCPGTLIEHMQLDLASLASIRRFAEGFRAAARPIDVLILNAG
jgi:NAD(P)-dependent dehydrogenase (short-subunit alcohol dehydrogenase family)